MGALEAFDVYEKFIDLTEPNNVEEVKEVIAKLDLIINEPDETLKLIQHLNTKLAEKKTALRLELATKNTGIAKILFRQNNKSKFRELDSIKLAIRKTERIYMQNLQLAKSASVKRDRLVKLLSSVGVEINGNGWN